jgi:hypothetical protein
MIKTNNLSYLDLSYANLSFTDLSNSNLSYANLSFTDLSYASLSYANLSFTDLSYANLNYTDLSFTDLSYASLSYTDLSFTDLSYANLNYTDLSYASLSYANLSNVNLSNANLMTFSNFFETYIIKNLNTTIILELIDSKFSNLELKSIANLFKNFLNKKEYEYAAYIIYAANVFKKWKPLYSYLKNNYKKLLEDFNFDKLVLSSQYLCKQLILDDDEKDINYIALQNIEIILNNPILDYVLLESPELIQKLLPYSIHD